MQQQSIIALLIGIVIGGAASTFYFLSIESQAPQLNFAENDVHHMHDDAMPHGMDGHMMDDMVVSSERQFITHMIPHHQEAIDTAREVLERGGTTEEIRDLMNHIITAQTAEIESMKAWHEAWYGEPYKDTGEYVPMMRELADLSGASLDQAFLEDMIAHHMGAIMMARSVQPYIEHEEVTALTQAIIETQSAEMVLMRELLESL